jgi:glycolate dehydrogenase iron-sulfur subunit
MQTSFTLEQLADPDTAEADKILRACVHCGFCTATCPTYVLLGNELDSPRGRIYLIKDMLENDRPATGEVVKHIDRCLSCLACMTTCPSGVHYMHLVDHARDHIERTYTRPLGDRLVREVLARVLPDGRLFRVAAVAGMLGKPFAPVLKALGLRRLAAMLKLIPPRVAPPNDPARKVHPAQGARRARVAVHAGCLNPVLSPTTNESVIRVLNRAGVEVVIAAGDGCCGSLVHHMGRGDQALAQARALIDAWMNEIEGEGLDAILITVSGCGTVVKDYGHLLRTDSAYAAKAERVSKLARDVTEYLYTLDLTPSGDAKSLTVAYHSACSLQHGQKVTRAPKDLLCKLNFVVKDVPEGHLCCGSAGTYNILQPSLADRLRDRKVGNIERLEPDVVAAGNIGCITQIAAGTGIPVVHTVELIDWATGGPVPERLRGLAEGQTATTAG